METKEILKFLIKYFVFGGLILLGIAMLIIKISDFRNEKWVQNLECEKATQKQIDMIYFGLKEGLIITNVYQYKSENGYFVAAEVNSRDQQKQYGVGVWHLYGEILNPSLPFCVDDLACQSTKDFLIDIDEDLSMYDQGAKEAEYCAENN